MDAEDLWASLFEFTLAEIAEMESMYKKIGEESLNPEFCERLATSFSCSFYRIGKPAITWQQVQCWFEDKHKHIQAKAKSPVLALTLYADPSDASTPGTEAQSLLKQKGNTDTDLSELAFEARSAKDDAWYDVASFLTHRVLSNGELEVRVRFAGFGYKEDEWVNVIDAVRERSIPLEPSECHMVKVGDHMLCFQEREHQAVYCDAHVLEIQRHMHDASKCTCTFLVQYDDDGAKEEVQLGTLCCRPSHSSSSALKLLTYMV